MSKEIKCSFCEQKDYETDLLISNEDESSYICLDCNTNIYTITKEDELEALEKLESSNDNANGKKILKPKELKTILDGYIIGQTEAKEKVSVSVYNHFKRVKHNNSNTGVVISKSNILLIGPSGSGKTLIVESLSNALDVPFVISDATTLTEAGYVGDDVNSMLLKLLEKTNWDVEKAEKGIIFIDEIDKIARKVVGGRDSSRDIAGEGVQQALLKIIEGSEVFVEQDPKSSSGKSVTINTKNILFIVAGAFSGLEHIIKDRLSLNKKSLDFIPSEKISNEKKASLKNELLHQVSSEDLISFGIIPELLGRIPSISVLDKLTEEQMVDILSAPKNSLTKQFKKLFEIDDVDLRFEKKALLEIVKIAESRKIGARGLRSVMEELLQQIMFNIDDHKDKTIVVTPKLVKNNIKKRVL